MKLFVRRLRGGTDRFCLQPCVLHLGWQGVLCICKRGSLVRHGPTRSICVCDHHVHCHHSTKPELSFDQVFQAMLIHYRMHNQRTGQSTPSCCSDALSWLLNRVPCCMHRSDGSLQAVPCKTRVRWGRGVRGEGAGELCLRRVEARHGPHSRVLLVCGLIACGFEDVNADLDVPLRSPSPPSCFPLPSTPPLSHPPAPAALAPLCLPLPSPSTFPQHTPTTQPNQL